MKIKYMGPSQAVNVHPYGEHRRNEIKEYPENFAKELLATSRKQQFIMYIDSAKNSAIEDKKCPGNITSMTKKYGKIKANAKKRSY